MENEIPTKKCSICNEVKTIDNFTKQKGGKFGVMGQCTSCQRKRANERRKELRKLNRSKKERKYLVSKDDPTYARRMMLMSEYKITLDEYEELLKKQDYVCAICGNKETRVVNGNVRSLCVDHCHTTGKVRGLLCTNCNLFIGNSKDSPKYLLEGIKYLLKSRMEDQEDEQKILMEINKLMLISDLENQKFNSTFILNKNKTDNIIWKK